MRIFFAVVDLQFDMIASDAKVKDNGCVNNLENSAIVVDDNCN